MKSQRGFTWVELAIVVAIIGILAAVVIPNVVGLMNRHSGQSEAALTPTPTPILTPCSEWIESDIYTTDTYSGIALSGNLTNITSGNITYGFQWGWGTTSHAISTPTPCCPPAGGGWSLPTPAPEPTPEPACSTINITLMKEDYSDLCDFTYTGSHTHRWNEKYPFDDFVHSPCLATLGYDLTSAPWGCSNKDDQYRIYYPKSLGFGELYVGRETFFYIAFHFNTSQFFFNSETCAEALIWDIQVPTGWEISSIEWDEYTHFYQWE